MLENFLSFLRSDCCQKNQSQVIEVHLCVCLDLAQVQSRHQESLEENQQPGSPQQV